MGENGMIDLALAKLNDVVELCYEHGDVDDILHLVEEIIQILEYEEGY